MSEPFTLDEQIEYMERASLTGVEFYAKRNGAVAVSLRRLKAHIAHDPARSSDTTFPDDRAVCPHCGEVAEWNDCSVCGGDGGAYVCYYCKADG